MAKIWVLHGPNLNLLGTREPHHYGNRSLDAINRGLQSLAQGMGHQVECFQSNAEHELIARIHAARDQEVAFLVINPAAFTHTSIALRDALMAIDIPFVEIHLSNVYRREAFRHHSYFSDIAVGVITGLGPIGYELALRAAMDHLSQSPDR